MAGRISGGKGAAIGPLTARVVAGRYEVGGLRLHEALFDLYDAHDRRLNSTIGFRAALAQVITRRPLVERLEQVFRSLRGFSHPNVIEIHDVFREVSQMYVTQEAALGPSISEIVEFRGERHLSGEEAMALAVVLTSALASGHAAGLVHGGIQPDVVRLAEPVTPKELNEPFYLKADRLFLGSRMLTPKFMNYGMGPVESGVTSTRKSYGLQASKGDEYLPPEQLTGLSPESRSDFFSLACLVHFCVTGRPPGGTSTRIAREVGNSKTGDMPPPLIPVLMRALHRAPAERYASAEEMAESFQKVYDYLKANAPAPPPPPEATDESKAKDARAPGAPPPRTFASPRLSPPGAIPARAVPTARHPSPPPEEHRRTPPPPGSLEKEAHAPSGPSPASPPPPAPDSPQRRPTPERVVLPKTEREPPWPPRRDTERDPREEREKRRDAHFAKRDDSDPPEERIGSGSAFQSSVRSPLITPPPPQSTERPPSPATAPTEPPSPATAPTEPPARSPPKPPSPSKPPSPPPAPSGPVTPLALAPSTEGRPARLPRTVTPLAILPEMALVPGGTYRMGSGDLEDANPVHPCTVDAFYMAVHPVTNEQYRCFVLTDGHPPPKVQTEQYAIWDGTRFAHEQARRPVVHISWNDAMDYCRWMREMTGETYRLPTEAEWERAARGGIEDALYPWGDDDPDDRVAFDRLWTGPTVIPEVASHQPNGYGLHDMAGSVWEWCRDFYHRRYYELPEATEPNPVNDAPSMQRVQRGGAWLTGAQMLRCAYRGKHRPDSATVGFGFRIVREP